MVKNLLEFFFTRYSEVTSSLIHTMSQENLEFILSTCNHFDDGDLATIYKVGTYDNIYGITQDEDHMNFAVFQEDFLSNSDLPKNDAQIQIREK